MLPHLALYVLREPGAAVVHREHHPRNRKPRVQLSLYQRERVEQARQPLEGEVLGLDGDQHAVGGDERVDGQQAERRRAVDEDQVVFVRDLGERTPQHHLAADLAAQQQLGLGEVADDYDLILIDCPPSLGLLTVNALVAADYALISTEAEYFSLQGVEQALEVVEAARGLSPDLKWLGAVLNIADMRTVHAREALEQLQEGYGDKIFDTPIRRSVAYAESAERAVSIVDHRPDLGADYLSLADEVLVRLGREDDRKALKKLRAELTPA